MSQISYKKMNKQRKVEIKKAKEEKRVKGRNSIKILE